MTQSRDNRNKQPRVTFTLEERELTSAQKDAGEKLFSRLIERAQGQMEKETEIKEQGRNWEQQAK